MQRRLFCSNILIRTDSTMRCAQRILMIIISMRSGVSQMRRILSPSIRTAFLHIANPVDGSSNVSHHAILLLLLLFLFLFLSCHVMLCYVIHSCKMRACKLLHHLHISLHIACKYLYSALLPPFISTEQKRLNSPFAREIMLYRMQKETLLLKIIISTDWL
jgi:hypothetical protein